MKNPFIFKKELCSNCYEWKQKGFYLCPAHQQINNASSSSTSIASEIFADLDAIIKSGYPYKRFHPRKYNMLKKKYL